VEDTLRRKSIYKGKAIVGVGKVTRDGYDDPSFLDPFAIDPERVAYRQEVFDNLESSVWGPIRTADLQREANNPIGLKTLLYGPYGTGKSLAGGLTARTAVENGWTFIQSKTGDGEDLSKVLKTAELYAPAVVFIEDIDTLMDSDPDAMSKLLEMFDGVSSKNKEVMVLMTSNHVDSLSKGMTRVGRIDSAIEIGDLDRAGIERLIRATFRPNQLADDIDFDEICEAMEGYEPAFIMGTFKRTKSNAIIRTNSLDFKLTTKDFVLAALGLRNQHDTHTNAKDRPEVESFGAAFKSMVKESTSETLVGHQIDLDDGEIMARSN
jgi:transitional endoplasmic reticulum ATPase